MRSMPSISLYAWPDPGGGGKGEGVRGSRNLGGGSASSKLSTTKDSQKLMIYMQFSYP